MHASCRHIRAGLHGRHWQLIMEMQQTARIVASYLSEHFGHQVIIENRPGAGNNLGTEAVIGAAPDGHTLLLVNPANAINTTLYKKLSFNYLKDTVQVAGIIRVPLHAVEADIKGKRLEVLFRTAALSPERICAYHSKMKRLPAKTADFMSFLETVVPLAGSNGNS